MKKQTIILAAAVWAASLSTTAIAEPVEFKVLSDWGSGYTAQLKLTNESDSSMKDWRLSFDYDGEVKNLYSGNLISGKDGHYIIEGKSFNRTLKPGQSVYMGWNGRSGNVPAKLSNVNFSATDIDVPQGPYMVGYDLQADWGSGYVASINVTNSGEQNMESWQLSFDYPYPVEHIYNAKIVSHQGDRYTIEGIDEGTDLSPNEVTVFVIRGNAGGVTEQPGNIAVTYR